MQYSEQYRTELLNALGNINLRDVDQAVEILREARAHGRCIFVCGSGGNGPSASHLLYDILRSSAVSRAIRFRIFALTDELPSMSGAGNDLFRETVFVDQLRSVAEAGDVVAGISASGNSPPLLKAFAYAKEIGCRTICVSGAAGKLSSLSDAAILAPSSRLANADDLHRKLSR
jgi:phosphoheptose isomerase